MDRKNKILSNFLLKKTSGSRSNVLGIYHQKGKTKTGTSGPIQEFEREEMNQKANSWVKDETRGFTARKRLVYSHK